MRHATRLSRRSPMRSRPQSLRRVERISDYGAIHLRLEQKCSFESASCASFGSCARCIGYVHFVTFVTCVLPLYMWRVSSVDGLLVECMYTTRKKRIPS